MKKFVKFEETSFDVKRSVWVKPEAVTSICDTCPPSSSCLIGIEGGETFLVQDSPQNAFKKLEIEY